MLRVLRARAAALRRRAGADRTGASLNTPRGFIPSQDMGYLLVNIQLPDSASLERTQNVIVKMEEIAHKIKGVDATVGVAGQSLLHERLRVEFRHDVRDTQGHSTSGRRRTLYYEAIANKLRSQLPARGHRRQGRRSSARRRCAASAGPAAS